MNTLSGQIHIAQPAAKTSEDKALIVCKNRLVVIMFATILMFCVLIYKAFEISLSNREDIRLAKRESTEFYVQRGSITDRNGVLIAVNLNTASLYANPQKVIDPVGSAEKLCSALAIKKCKELENNFKSNKTFVWVKRHLSPKEQQAIYNLGITGLNFINEEKRVYTHNNLFAHAVGFVDLDGKGMSGIERYFNDDLTSNMKIGLELSLDIRVQQILREELSNQINDHKALGGSGIVMDAETGEIIAMVSLPDFDPHRISDATDRQKFNQVTLGNYEMGSTFKILTLAMGLDGKFIKLNDAFDTGMVIKIGSHQIKNYKNKTGIMSVPEILMHSSNIGVAQIAMRAGAKNQRTFLESFGLLKAPEIELFEVSHPLYPSAKSWNQASMITISFGHGIAVSPLHVVTTMAAVVNGGKLLKPTLLKVDDREAIQYKETISLETSKLMRKILRLVATHGSSKRANIDGYLVGGKTGTAEKIIGGRYSKTANMASFIGAFPMHKPRYVVLTIIDEAKPGANNGGITTGGMIAAPVAGRVIERISPILGVSPVDENQESVQELMQVNFVPRLQKLN